MFHDFLNLLYPRFCQACAVSLLRNENVICTECLHKLPAVPNRDHNDNPVFKVFYGRINLVSATSLLKFEKGGLVQQLLHNLKYRGQEEVGDYLGKWLGGELKSSASCKNITAVIPVPLHKKKLKKRGYNQVDLFGKRIAEALGVPYIDNVLVKKTVTSSQTLKSRLKRWGNVEEAFIIENPHLLEGGHVLLVDDVITTGATIEACAEKLLDIPGLRLSVATMALAQ